MTPRVDVAPLRVCLQISESSSDQGNDMYFERMYDDDLAAASYIIGCASAGQAFVVDPLLSIDRYLDRASELGFEITGVLETHIHADFVSVGRTLAKAVGATLYVSAETPEEWTYQLDDVDARPMADGEILELGNIRFEVVHTPGHTPEHVSYLVTDTARGTAPAMLLSGDFAFVGDLGRPDLLETAAGVKGSGRELAIRQYQSVVETLMELPEDVQVWPGHGAGSACGKSLGSAPSTTIGYERKTAWWAPFVEQHDETGFADELLTGQPETPAYFARMKQLNRDGFDAEPMLTRLPRLTPSRAGQLLGVEALAVDVTSRDTFAEEHVSGAINMPSLANLATHSGAVLPYDRPLVVLCEPGQADAVTRKFRNVGLFNVEGWLPRNEAMAQAETSTTLSLDALQAAQAIRDGAIPLDVRSASEFSEGHLDEAVHRHYAGLAHTAADLSKDAKYVTYCGSGIRASIAASILQSGGYDVAAGGGFSALDAEL